MFQYLNLWRLFVLFQKMLIGVFPLALDGNMLSKTLYDIAHPLCVSPNGFVNHLQGNKPQGKAYSTEDTVRRWEE